MDFREILFVSDFDFTLTDSNRVIPPENIEAIRRFIAGGGAFTVGTGRAKASFAPQYARVPTNAPAIVANGALIYDFEKEEAVEISPLLPEEREIVKTLAARFCEGVTMTVESGLEVYLPDDVYAVAENEYTRRHYAEVGVTAKRAPIDAIPMPWLKAVFTGEPEVLNRLGEAAAEAGLPGVRSMRFMFELQNRETNKGSAARRLANRLGRRVLVCAGDEQNDLAMLREADLAFVPESAPDYMREPGFLVAAHIDKGVIADILRRLEAV